MGSADLTQLLCLKQQLTQSECARHYRVGCEERPSALGMWKVGCQCDLQSGPEAAGVASDGASHL